MRDTLLTRKHQWKMISAQLDDELLRLRKRRQELEETGNKNEDIIKRESDMLKVTKMPFRI